MNKHKEVFLKVLNKILTNSGKSEIKEIDDFVDIPRNDILDNSNIIDEMQEELFEVFDKYELRWYNKKFIKQYHLTAIKRMAIKTGYKFTSRSVSVSKSVDNIIHTTRHCAYSLSKIQIYTFQIIHIIWWHENNIEILSILFYIVYGLW